ncbi:MAG: glycosyl hydrolase family 28-related protein, partial [Planctomycetota bacterium]
MKKLLLIILMLSIWATPSYSATQGYGADALIGGAGAALDAIDGGQLNDGDKATVYLTGGPPLYYNLDATSGAAEDSPFVISPDSAAGTKRWILLNDDPIYPQWFGVVGDGVTDDTTNINLAIGAISAGDTLFFPQGTYIVSSALTAIPSNTSVVGAGRNKTII